MGILDASGTLIVRGDDEGAMDVASLAKCTVWTYGPGQEWDGRMESVDTEAGTMTFTVLRRGEPVGTFVTSLVGEHNLYNQVAATAATLAYGLQADQLPQGFSSFQGIKRRQEIIGEPGGVTVLDDFAHHPTAVKVTLEALRERFGARRLWAVWEPRSATSRRNVFQDDYATAFGAADQVVVAKPYDQTRIDEADRFSSERLVQDLSARGTDAVCLAGADEIAQTLAVRAHPRDVIAILSNGGFGGLHQKLLQMLHERFAE